jgi:hypothetical protein
MVELSGPRAADINLGQKLGLPRPNLFSAPRAFPPSDSAPTSPAAAAAAQAKGCEGKGERAGRGQEECGGRALRLEKSLRYACFLNWDPDPESAPEWDSGDGFRPGFRVQNSKEPFICAPNGAASARRLGGAGLIMDSEARKSARVSVQASRTRVPTFGPHYP